jgi:hypothetical protein
MLRFGGESDDDDEAIFEADDADDEAVRYPYRRPVTGRQPYTSGARPVQSGTMQVPGAGTAQVQFSKRLVSEDDFKKALEMVRQDIRKNTSAIDGLDKQFSSNLKGLKGQVEQGSMFPLLMTFMQPKLSNITFASGTTLEAGKALPVSASAQTDGMMMPLLLMMMMGGGGGGFMGMGGDSSGKGGGQDMMMMMLLMMTMSGKL